MTTPIAPAATTDGLVVEVTANLAGLDDALAAARHGVDAVGLLRTEFLFLDHHDLPTRASRWRPTCPSPRRWTAAG